MKKENFFKLIGIIAFVTVIGFLMAACNDGGSSKGSSNSKDNDKGTWVDPAAQTTPLSGGMELSGYSGGHKNLPGSPYWYETWDFSEGSIASTSKFIWY